MKIAVKPLSVNQAWQGKRFKTKEYKAYEKEVLLNLRSVKIPGGELKITLDFGVSNASFDWDNGIKSFVDILQKKYGFDDKRIYLGVVSKTITKKGWEYIKFSIEPLNTERS